MKLPLIDRIWRAEGTLPLEPSQSAADAFSKLDPLFQTNGTSYDVESDTLTFNKVNPAAQDKMATFTRGTLRVVGDGGNRKLAYDVSSPALLYCFLAPLFFLAFAAFFQFTATPAKQDETAREASEKKEDKETKEIALNPIDKFLGAPEPEKPKKDDSKDESKDKGSKGPSPTPAYVFAALFAVLYVVGRILEPYLLRLEFRRRLRGEAETEGEAALAK